ncbi:signal peptidase I [Enhygromyxa salina]|uniref:Signal peptidase I n=1 Tax=Enhygromyxa salina TaxID=215803 RepID=A0A2S9YQA4_9BACT|nr:signal peptidase I [Enhygromyxa salina]PRQ07285.1 Signal peptidase I [Enhygromyxa salina]
MPDDDTQHAARDEAATTEATTPVSGDANSEVSGEPQGRNARANVKRGPRVSRRSAGHVRSGARMLSREAARILRKHRARIDAKVIAEIEATLAEIESIRSQRPDEDLAALEFQAEHLDELLHQHASFARKSALRDTIENIVIAVVVALGVRSCIYEPFKIPSGSMMPTLRAGDHIFVNKFAYGVQIPLTTKVVGEDWISGIQRGDVIVFRFPLDESDDFIKRVIGLPGDTIRVNADRRNIAIKRAGADKFETVAREKIEDEKCQAENSTQTIENCTLYRETLDEHTYQVRYRDDLRSNDPSFRTFEVPDGYLLVMGDNRNASHDSLAWTVSGDTVTAAGLLSRPDIRDLTAIENERLELHDDGDTIRSNDDGHHDEVRYLAERSDPARDLTLEAWRAPPIDARAIFESLAANYGATETTTFATLMGKQLGADDDRIAEYGAKLGELRYAKHEATSELVFWAPTADVVFRLHCGVKRCAKPADLASRAAQVIKSFEANPDYDARELLTYEYGRTQTYPGRGQRDTRYLERRFGSEHDGVRIRAWRAPHEGLAVLRDAALAEYGAGPLAPAMQARYELAALASTEAAVATDLGPQAWVLEHEHGWTVVHADEDEQMLSVLDCGPKRCKSRTDALALATTVASRFPVVNKDRDRLSELLGQADVGGLPEQPPVGPPIGYFWDHLTVVGVVLDDSHSVNIQVEIEPEGGLEAALEARKQELRAPEAVEGLGPVAWYADTPNGHTFLFSVPETKMLVELACRPGLCPDRETARALAERAREKGLDPENYLQKGVSRPRPFVPRGNVKGRAEVIWWPSTRFWKNID